MEYRTIVAFLITILLASCAQQILIEEVPKENVNIQQVKFKSGLKIKNRINRGTNYTDALGVDYSIRNIPIAITNDSTISVQLQIAFSAEYNFTNPESEEKFKLIPLPKEWALDGLGVTDSMLDELPQYIEKPELQVTIKPGEELLLSIGSLYPRPTKTSGILPRTLFVQSDTMTFPECEWLREKDQPSNQQIPLGLKIIMGERCMIIPCGSISYLEKGIK